MSETSTDSYGRLSSNMQTTDIIDSITNFEDEEEDEMSDLDDDMMDGEKIRDWFDEDEEELIPTTQHSVIKNEIPDDVFMKNNVDLFFALCDIDVWDFGAIPYSQQIEIMSTLTITTYHKSENVYVEKDSHSESFFIVIASEETCAFAELNVFRDSESSITKLKRGHIFGFKYFLVKQSVCQFDLLLQYCPLIAAFTLPLFCFTGPERLHNWC